MVNDYLLMLVATASLSFNTVEGLLYCPRNQPSRGLILKNELNDSESMKVRRRKKNKYEKYSVTDKREKDPLDELIDESLLKRKSLERPGERKFMNNRMKIDLKKYDDKRLTFPDNRDIDPYDPTTYGFVEVGKITGAHG